MPSTKTRPIVDTITATPEQITAMTHAEARQVLIGFCAAQTPRHTIKSLDAVIDHLRRTVAADGQVVRIPMYTDAGVALHNCLEDMIASNGPASAIGTPVIAGSGGAHAALLTVTDATPGTHFATRPVQYSCGSYTQITNSPS